MEFTLRTFLKRAFAGKIDGVELLSDISEIEEEIPTFEVHVRHFLAEFYVVIQWVPRIYAINLFAQQSAWAMLEERDELSFDDAVSSQSVLVLRKDLHDRAYRKSLFRYFRHAVSVLCLEYAGALELVKTFDDPDASEYWQH